MKVLGLVQWTDWDKRGVPIAGVRPLIEIQKSDWRAVDAAEEFPSLGQVFWPNAQGAAENALVFFRPEPNPGHKDEYRVVDPKPAPEVLDLRRFGPPGSVRGALVAGVHCPRAVGSGRFLIWCKPDVLLGPVELRRNGNDTLRLVTTNLPRLAAYAPTQLRSIIDSQGTERLIRVDDNPPSGFVDWDDDPAVLRRALEVAVKVARQAGPDPGQTKKQIEEAAQVLASQGVGPAAQLDRYRLERAVELLADTEFVVSQSADLSEALLQHPAVQARLSELTAQVRADVEQQARIDLEQRLESERAKLQDVTEDHRRAVADLSLRRQELQATEERLRCLRQEFASAAEQAEAAVQARVLAAIDRPLDLLAEVGVLRPLLFGSASRAGNAPNTEVSPRIDWSRARGADVKDKASLRRVLMSAARARGVEPSLMLHIHAAVAAGLMPVTVGPCALAALTAYAEGACGGRALIVNVSPGFIQPRDLDVLPGGGIAAAGAAAATLDGLSLVVLEGANRSPLEASVLPLLQMRDIGLPPAPSAPGLRLVATLVAGATTVPVTPQLWSHAVAVYPEPGLSAAPTADLGDVALSSELFVPGDEPTGAIEGLIDAFPDCGDLRPALSRFGAALTRLYDEEARINDALLSGLILPYLATALTSEEQAEVLSKGGDTDVPLAKALRRLRRSLA